MFISVYFVVAYLALYCLDIWIGSLCADTLAAHPDDFSPFCEFPEDDDDTDSTNMGKYEQYVSKVRLSSEWGGHLELRALAMALERSILVYQSNSPDPLEIVGGGVPTPANEPIRLSYHKHYYALGEHYNQVVPMTDGGGHDDDDDDE
jgi:OTU domain-containing protein 6